MPRALIQPDLRRGRVANRLGVALLVALTTVLVLSVYLGVRHLGAA